MKTIKATDSAVNPQCADIILISRDLNSQAFEYEEGLITHEDCGLLNAFVY